LREGATPASFVVQNAVVGVVKEQTQLEVGQGLVRLQVPPQVDPWKPFRNCRAETVPAQRTPMASAVKNIDLIFLFMTLSSCSRNLTDDYLALPARLLLPATCLSWIRAARHPQSERGGKVNSSPGNRGGLCSEQADATAQPSPVLWARRSNPWLLMSFSVCLVYGGSETQDPRVAPLICTQEHAPLHGWVALQRPLQTPTTPGCLCNCRAETLPAKRTPVTSALSSVALIFFLMAGSPFSKINLRIF
jgi:hypothetical protein